MLKNNQNNEASEDSLLSLASPLLSLSLPVSGFFTLILEPANFAC